MIGVDPQHVARIALSAVAGEFLFFYLIGKVLRPRFGVAPPSRAIPCCVYPVSFHLSLSKLVADQVPQPPRRAPTSEAPEVGSCPRLHLVLEIGTFWQEGGASIGRVAQTPPLDRWLGFSRRDRRRFSRVSARRKEAEQHL